MDVNALLEKILTEESRRACEASLVEFIRQSWHIIEPGVVFSPGWHLDVICEHLEAVTDGEIKRLLINIPPRHAKSSIVAVCWPAWEWTKRPTEKYLCASYSGVLSTRDALKARRLIQSPWYQARWGHVFAMTGDQNAKQRYENDRTGYRIASSVGGTATGEGGSRLILDDPHGAQDAQSDAMRETALEWFSQVWSTRLNDPSADSMITIMQRLHERDVSGHIIHELGNWEHVCLPAEWDSIRRKSVLGFYDPRQIDGELLWPDRFNKSVLDGIKKSLGEYGTAGQLQQSPSPPGGGILKIDHFQLWPHDKPLPVFDYVVQSVDPAYTEKTSNDPSAFQAWGVFSEKGKKGAMLLDAWAEHLPYPDLRARLIDEWHSVYASDEMRKGKKADVLLIEAKASGLSLIQDLRSANLPAVPYNPGKADKSNRAHQASPILELDCLYILESKKDKGRPVTWARSMISELEKFPNGEHDDQVDAFTQSMIYLRDMNMFDLDFAEPDEVEDIDYYEKKKTRVNPYAV